MAANEARQKRADLPDDATWEKKDDGSKQEREALHEAQRGWVERIEEATGHQRTQALHTGYGGKQSPCGEKCDRVFRLNQKKKTRHLPRLHQHTLTLSDIYNKRVTETEFRHSLWCLTLL